MKTTRAGDRRPTEAKFAMLRLADAKRFYEETGNPACVWDAYLGYRCSKLPVPEWVMSYLDAVAMEIQSVRLERDNQNANARVLKTLGMSRRGAGNWVSDLYRPGEEVMIAMRVDWHLRGKVRTKAAIGLVAEEFGVSQRTVAAIWARQRSAVRV